MGNDSVADVLNNFSIAKQLYSEIKHSEWIFQVTRIILTTQSNLFQSRVVGSWPRFESAFGGLKKFEYSIFA